MAHRRKNVPVRNGTTISQRSGLLPPKLSSEGRVESRVSRTCESREVTVTSPISS